MNQFVKYFHKTPSAVLAEPSTVEIVARVEHLIRLGKVIQKTSRKLQTRNGGY